MAIKLKFLGAAQNVTGSRYVIETGSARVLVDCGTYQERELNVRNWDPFPVPPASLNAVLLTHAHLDHCGSLPRLARDGFRGPVFATDATVDIAKLTLLDSARLQEEDAAFKRRRHAREGRQGPHPELPLYTVADVQACARQFQPVAYGQPRAVAEGLEATWFDAGHILGSALIQMRIRDGNRACTVVFSGDVGRWERPILQDPTPCPPADYVLVESTYGARLHEDAASIADLLATAICGTRERGGNVVIPAFVIERTQDVLYYLNDLLRANRIPHLVVFVDSPMAISVTEVFEQHPEIVDAEMLQRLRSHASPFHFTGLKMVRAVDESKAINHIQGTSIIMAGSGMCTGGRIKYHLANNLSRPECTVLFVGYQAVGTLGRVIADGASSVRVLGQTITVRAQVARINGFSAHADRNELQRWLAGLEGHPPRQVFVTHGEPAAAASFAALLRQKAGWAATAPQYGDEVTLAG